MKTSTKFLIVTISLQFILSLIAIIVLSSKLKSNLLVASGKTVTDEIKLNSFNSIMISGNITVHWKCSDSVYAKMTIDEAFKNHIKLHQTSNQLTINAPKVFRRKNALLTLYSPNISSLIIRNGAIVLFDDTLKVEKLQIDLKDGADANLKYSGNNLKMSLSDGSSVQVEGNATKSEMYIKDGSSVSLDKLNLLIANATVKDGSSLKVNVKDSISAIIEDGSSIYIDGKPKIKQIKTDQSSSVQ
ncbi:MAG: DUF2807 domain-containing protein [Bacteroidales bacterium]|nr:DUF2807 domain-containing protein [Bacteroidales bacterium]